MIEDKKEHKPQIFLVVDRDNKVVAYTAVNVPKATLIREDEDKELFDKMVAEGAAAIADPTVNYITGLGVKV